MNIILFWNYFVSRRLIKDWFDVDSAKTIGYDWYGGEGFPINIHAFMCV